MADVSVLLVDDEVHARRRMRRALSGAKGIAIVGEAEDGRSALAAAAALKPDLILLDVRMPGMDGLEVVRSLPEPLPAIIFVTAHDDYAIPAFRSHAADYILKPYDEQLLLAATLRAAERRGMEEQAARVTSLLETLEQLRRRLADHEIPPVEFWVESRGRHLRVPDSAVEWISAEGDFVRLHTEGGSHLLCESLTAIAAKLQPRGFRRVHRGAVVRVAAVASISPYGFGGMALKLRDGTMVKVGRTYQKEVRHTLRGSRTFSPDDDEASNRPKG